MKKSNFYPNQVQRKLLRKGVQNLSAVESHALNYFALRTYPLGPQVTILQPDINAGSFEAWMDSVRANTQTRILLKPA